MKNTRQESDIYQYAKWHFFALVVTFLVFNFIYMSESGAQQWQVQGSLPPGLSLNPETGKISGTPTEAGTYTFTIKVTDSSNPPKEATKQFTITIKPALCEGDFDKDGDVDISDFQTFYADFYRTDCSPDNPCNGDFDKDGDVDASDLAVFNANFGRTDCPH